MKSRKASSGLKRSAWTGRVFMLPWMIGVLLFFLIPLAQSLLFSFQEVKLDRNSFSAPWAGIQHYVDIFTKDPTYVKTLLNALKNMAYQVPIILIFSLFAAVLLNQKFKGVTVVRAIMFLPVIMSSGVIISILGNDVFATSVVENGGSQATFMFKGVALQDMLLSAGINQSIVNVAMNFVNQIFDTLWKTGVQIILFLSSLQSVPRSAYEAAQVEGSTAWETFWLITFPLVSPMILVNLVYTIVDSFTDYNNPVLQAINNTAFTQFQYSYSSAMAWVYFISILIILAVVGGLISRKVFYMAE